MESDDARGSDDALREALRLAVDPPGGVSVEALRELARGDDATDWDIATAAAHLGVNPHTLRYYERIGLLSKAARRNNGYRDYTSAEVERLRFIARGRELGFGLDEIQGLLTLAEQTDMPCADVDRLARQHLADIQGRIRTLQHMARELTHTIEACAGGARAGCAILGDLQAPASQRKSGVPASKGRLGAATGSRRASR